MGPGMNMPPITGRVRAEGVSSATAILAPGAGRVKEALRPAGGKRAVLKSLTFRGEEPAEPKYPESKMLNPTTTLRS
jgi:hypothetical protein